jgi:hypothetical protein
LTSIRPAAGFVPSSKPPKLWSTTSVPNGVIEKTQALLLPFETCKEIESAALGLSSIL